MADQRRETNDCLFHSCDNLSSRTSIVVIDNAAIANSPTAVRSRQDTVPRLLTCMARFCGEKKSRLSTADESKLCSPRVAATACRMTAMAQSWPLAYSIIIMTRDPSNNHC